jgi:hypothetical protein
MSDIHVRRLLTATLSPGKRAWLCGLLILADTAGPTLCDAHSAAEGARD